MRNPFRRASSTPPDPRRPHPFVDGRDAGLAAFASGGAGGRSAIGDNVQQVAMTSAYQRTEGCGVPGCGRSRTDVIHAPPEDRSGSEQTMPPVGGA